MTSHPITSTEFASSRIADLVEVAANRQPGAPALIVTADRVPLSYHDLVRLVDDLAGQLTRGGLLPGDRVALRAASNAEFVVGLLAASRADLIVVPLDPALPVSDQHARSAAAGARVMLVDDLVDLKAPDDAGESKLPCWPIAVSVGQGAADPSVRLDTSAPPNPVNSAPDGLQPGDAMIMFTGGTTGLPKMVPWTQANIAGSVRAIVAEYGLGPAGCDRRGDAALPRARADRRLAVDPGIRGHRVAARSRAVLGAHVLGGHRRRRCHLVHGGADDSPDPVGAQQDRSGSRLSGSGCIAVHP